MARLPMLLPFPIFVRLRLESLPFLPGQFLRVVTVVDDGRTGVAGWTVPVFSDQLPMGCTDIHPQLWNKVVQ